MSNSLALKSVTYLGDTVLLWEISLVCLYITECLRLQTTISFTTFYPFLTFRKFLDHESKC